MPTKRERQTSAVLCLASLGGIPPLYRRRARQAEMGEMIPRRRQTCRPRTDGRSRTCGTRSITLVPVTARRSAGGVDREGGLG